jgi:hypothetical protein
LKTPMFKVEDWFSCAHFKWTVHNAWKHIHKTFIMNLFIRRKTVIGRIFKISGAKPFNKLCLPYGELLNRFCGLPYAELLNRFGWLPYGELLNGFDDYLMANS